MRIKISVLFPFLLSSALFFGCMSASKTAKQNASKGDFYELRTYLIKDKAQEQLVENYLQNAFIPTLHRAGWSNIGVFKPVEKDTANFGKRLFVLIPAKSLDALAMLPKTLLNDPQYDAAGKAYLNLPNESPAYQRMEIAWMTAFTGHPHLETPNMTSQKSERVYEIRSYESATEKLFANKVHMFNVADEIALFKKLGFNAAFYSEVVAGARMPNLIYMICFDNAASRDAHWKSFVDSEEWKKMTALPEYKPKNVSKIDSYLLHPTPYSDF